MNPAVESELEILWSDFQKFDAEEKVEALERLKAATTKAEIPRLVEALRSERSDFWIRELLADPIAEIGGPEYLPELFDGLAKNEADGHDNDGYAHSLMETAWSEPKACRAKLQELLGSDNPKHREYATWLLEFCN